VAQLWTAAPDPEPGRPRQSAGIGGRPSTFTSMHQATIRSLEAWPVAPTNAYDTGQCHEPELAPAPTPAPAV